MAMGHGMGPVWRHMRTDRSTAQAKLRGDTVRRVLAFARPHRALIGVFLVLTVIDAALVVVSPLLVQRIVASDVETGRLFHESLGELDLRSPRVPRLGDHLWIGDCAVEVAVAVGGRAVQPGDVLAGHHRAECAALDLGQMSHDAEQ